jgi:hypothetical protein
MRIGNILRSFYEILYSSADAHISQARYCKDKPAHGQGHAILMTDITVVKWACPFKFEPRT